MYNKVNVDIIFSVKMKCFIYTFYRIFFLRILGRRVSHTTNIHTSHNEIDRENIYLK